MRELVDRGIVLDVCPTSNVVLGVAPTIRHHPLRRLHEAGVSCSISTDDPAPFDTNLTRECDSASSLGLSARVMCDSGLKGTLCDENASVA